MAHKMLAQLEDILGVLNASTPMPQLEQVNAILDLHNQGHGVIEIQMHVVQLSAVHLVQHVDASLVLYPHPNIAPVLE
jgi:hypothetical protein